MASLKCTNNINHTLIVMVGLLFVLTASVTGDDEHGNNSASGPGGQLLRRLLQYNNRPLYNMCSNRDKERMYQCDQYAADDWDISEVPQEYTGRRYCCYQWQSLKCQLKIAKRCDNTYASWLESDTETRIKSLCYYHGRYSASCA
ncbi:unnamed protein product, partial [Medioppia subpectinata]